MRKTAIIVSMLVQAVSTLQPAHAEAFSYMSQPEQYKLSLCYAQVFDASKAELVAYNKADPEEGIVRAGGYSKIAKAAVARCNKELPEQAKIYGQKDSDTFFSHTESKEWQFFNSCKTDKCKKFQELRKEIYPEKFIRAGNLLPAPHTP